MSDIKVLIVGAGPTGLTAALQLARHGIHPEIVERRTEPSELSRAVGIIPASIDKLRPTGVGDAILKEGMPFRKISYYRGTKQLMSFDLTKLTKKGEVMIGLPQNRTEFLMGEGLLRLGVEVQYGKAIVDIKTDNEMATVQFENGESIEYDWVIGADGVGSIVREKLEIPYNGIDLPDKWSIADVEINGDYDPQNFSAWIQGDNREFTFIMPIEPKRMLLLSSTPDAIKSLPIDLDIKKIRKTGTFNISVRQAETYQKGKVLLAGDAAHCHSPVGGKGMNLGIDDAVAAANAIINGTTNEYTDKRQKIGEHVLRLSENGRKFILSKNPMIKFFTSILFGVIHRTVFIQKLFVRKIGTL